MNFETPQPSVIEATVVEVPVAESDNLGAIITHSRTRKTVWAVYVLAGLTLGSLSAWFTTTEGSVPIWLQGALAVSAFLAAPFGTLAIANIPGRK